MEKMRFISELDDIAYSFDRTSGIKRCLYLLGKEFDVDRAVVFLYDNRQKTLSAEMVYLNGVVLVGDEDIFLSEYFPDPRVEVFSSGKPFIEASEVILPLVWGKEKYGILTVDRNLQNKPFLKHEIELLKKTATVISVGLHQHRVFLERESKLRQLRALLKIGLMLIEEKNLKRIARNICRTLIKYGGFDRVRLYLSHGAHLLRCVYGMSFLGVEKKPDRVFSFSDFERMEGLSSLYYFEPLKVGDLLGVIEVDNIISQIPIENDQLEFLKIIATQLSVALETVGLLKKLEEASITDAVTGVYNFRYFVSMAKGLIEKQKPFSILLIDLDNFKKINDRYGHLKGDELLIRFAKVLEDSSRKNDCVCRYGGDEFILIMKGTGPGRAVKISQRILQMIKRDKVLSRYRVAASGGVASFPYDGKTVSAVLKIADKRLYESKNSGKGCITGPDGLKT